MNAATFSERAERDFEEIIQFTTATWSVAQAVRYQAILEDAIDLLLRFPEMGRRFRHYRRYDVGSHVVFYRPVPAGLRIVRILHKRMLPELWLN